MRFEEIDDSIFTNSFNEGFQKGKLEQKKEELYFLKRFKKSRIISSVLIDEEWYNNLHNLLDKEIKQLSKEIGGMK